MKTVFTFLFLTISVACFSQNSIENKEKQQINTSSSISSIKIDENIDIESPNQIQMIEKNGVFVEPKTNLQYTEQDLLDKEQYLIDKTKNLSEVNPN